jgi:hypothetical protein
MALNKTYWKYLREQRKISIRFHHEWVAVGRGIVERREYRRKTRNVYQDYEGDPESGGSGPAGREKFAPIPLHAMFHEALRPTLSLGTWRANLRGARPALHESVERLEDNINWEMMETGWDKEVSFCDIHFLDYGRAVMKTGVGTPRTARTLADAGGAVYDPATGETLSLGEALADVGRMAAGNNGGGAPDQDTHTLWGGRRYPRGAIHQRAIHPEHVFAQYSAGRMEDAGVIWQRHYLTERQAHSILRDFDSVVPITQLPVYSLREHIEQLETELERRAGFQWALEEGILEEKIYLFYEGWWRDEGLYVWECDGYKARPIHVQKWPAPPGLYPYDFWDDSNRDGRLNPLGIMAGFDGEADSVNVLNSMAHAAARQAKTLIFIMKMLLDKDERKALESGKPLSVILTKKKIDKESLYIEQLQQNLDQWFQVIERAINAARMRIGLSSERLSTTSPGSTPTESMLQNKTGELLEAERMVGKRAFLADCCKKRIAFKHFARPLWPDRGGEGRKLQTGSLGMRQGQSPYELQKGFNEEELSQPLQVEINIVKKNPVHALQEYEQFKEWVRMAMQFGPIDPWGATDHAFDLLDVTNPRVKRPRPESPSAHEEHALILKGIPVQIQPSEDEIRHLQRHKLFESVVEAMLNNAVAEELKIHIDPLHVAYVKNYQEVSQMGEPTALERLKEHIASYGAGPAGAGGPSQAGLMKASTSPGAPAEGRAHARLRQEQQGGEVPFGAQGKGGMG